jgi:hypothetical protein
MDSPDAESPTYSLQRTRSVRDPLAEKQWDAINAFTAKHAEERAAKGQG